MFKDKILTIWNNEGINEKDTSILRKKSAEVPVPLDEASRKIIQILIDAFMERDDAVGLAAPQIGINKRVIIFRIKDFDEGQSKIKSINDIEVLVNPRITQERGEKVTMAEGCLSCPGVQVEISRFSTIKVRASDAKGQKINKNYEDYVARIIQHEIDHLDGKLIVDYEGQVYYPTKNEEVIKNFYKANL